MPIPSRLPAVLLAATLLAAPALAQQPTFEVATIKQIDPDHPAAAGRFLRMENDHHFVARNFPVNLLIAAAYDLNPRAISGEPPWADSDKFDIEALTPGSTRPTRDQQMAMLRDLLVSRLHLTFHRAPKDFSIYLLTVAKNGPKPLLKPTAADSPTAPSNVVCTVYPDHILLPARNVTLHDVTLMFQRAVFDRPVVDATNLTARYDFDLAWAPDDSQFGGQIPAPATAPNDPPLFVALQEQLGLKLEPTHGPISTLVVDRLDRPTAN